MSDTEKEVVDFVITAAAVVCFLVGVGLIIDGVGGLIKDAMKRKLYEMTVIYTDGSTVAKRGTKEELKAWFIANYHKK